MAPIPRLRPYSGPALLSYGFRAFFLFGSLYAGLAILVWLPLHLGELSLPTHFAPRDWHVHEMLYGFLPAVVAGFLLTAIPNWTGRLPLQGRPLLMLLLVWALGRVAVNLSGWIGWLPAAVLDGAFLAVLAAVTAREIAAGRNWRNLKVLIVLCALFAGNLVFHLEVHLNGTADYGTRLGVAASIVLIMLIGGRIVPSFTRNWLVRENPGRLPSPFGELDKWSLVLSGAALLIWIARPEGPVTAAALLAAGLGQAARLARWAGDRAWRDRLVFILHVAYAFIPLGFVLAGLSALGLVPVTAGVHAWTGGAVGAMTLAVMSRASLGHTGRPLTASGALQALYGLVVLSALTRIVVALAPEWSQVLLPAAGLGWAAAFLGFALAYWPVLTRARLPGQG
jgi:uncharacterized protein involved in response to NO